jgi:hypothetical protein
VSGARSPRLLATTYLSRYPDVAPGFGWVGVAILGALWAGVAMGCASTVATQQLPGTHPRIVTVVLTESLRFTPLSSEEKSDPTMREAIDACERSGGGRCLSRSTPGEPRNRFFRGDDGQVYVYVHLVGLEGGRVYDLRVRWFGPDRGVTSVMRQVLHTPPKLHRNFSFSVHFSVPVSRMAVGRWQVEISINGEVESERTFEVADPARTADPTIHVAVRAEPVARFSAATLARWFAPGSRP